MCESCELYAQDAADAAEQRDSLRAILAPLLDNPYRTIANYGDPYEECVFCECVPESHYPYGPNDRKDHEPDCPVLRKDELLGRA